MAEFTIVGPVVMGIIIGLIEMYFVHKDEGGMGWLSHGLHAIPVMFILLFISMNLDWALSFIPNIEISTLYVIIARVVIGIIAAVKVKAAAAIVKGTGEKLSHALIIGALIAVAPFGWELAIQPLVGDRLPFF